MIDTKALAKKILSGLSDSAFNNEAWIRDVLDEAFRGSNSYTKRLELEIELLSDELARLREVLGYPWDGSGVW